MAKRGSLRQLTRCGARLTFSPWIGSLILCGYAFALLVIGGVLLVRRDA